MKSLPLILLAAVLPLRAAAPRAGNLSPDSSAGALTVRSNRAGACVYLDSVRLGTAPLDSVAISQGRHLLTCTPPDPASWLVPAVTETLAVQPGERVVRQIDFPSVYHITSDPYGAEILIGDSLAGQTPAILAFGGAERSVVLRKAGYASAEIPLASGGGTVHAALVPRSDGKADARLNGERVKNMTPVYLSSGAALLGGAVAAYFKIKADGCYDDYRNTGDQASLDRMRRYDTVSGVALAGSQISLLLLSYFLFSR